ncbi:ATP-grasp domain-containing protein [Weissella viridescens]|uniref:ATP-grasp domain-containing protein n=1 Tax=Weissella viridescens TaxID=1629 RepID=UPI0017469D56|nr:ATP-grasp domain-containing protein [Weissella viridescens]QOD86501.1 ATP-grasp domain-containing protein [Weissella viridescens]
MSGDVLPGSTIGILGDDVMSAYLAQTARRQGFKIAGYSDYPDAPILKEADYRLVGREELVNFIALSDIVTYASSWVPSDVTAQLEQTGIELPQGFDLIGFTDDHALSKAFAEEQSFNVLPYEIGTSLDDVAVAARNLGYPVIVKPIYRHSQGNQAVVLKGAYDLGKVAPLIDGSPVIIESWLAEVQEYSMTLVRDQSGVTAVYPLRQTHRMDNGLTAAWTVGQTANGVRQEMLDIANKIGNVLGYVGAYAVHFFYADNGTLYLRDVTAGIERDDAMYTDNVTCSVEEQHLRVITGQKLMPIVAMQEAVYMPLTPENQEKLALHWEIQDNWRINVYPPTRYSSQSGHVVVSGADSAKILNQMQVANVWDFSKITTD